MHRVIACALLVACSSTPAAPAPPPPSPAKPPRPVDAAIAAADAPPPPPFIVTACPATAMVGEWWRHELWPGCAAMPFASAGIPALPARCTDCPHPCRAIFDGDRFTTDFDDRGRWWRTWNSNYSETCEFDGDAMSRCSIATRGTERLAETAKRDGRGRIVEITAEPSIRIAYDAAGDVVRVTSHESRASFTYDAEHRLIGERSDGLVITYRYDEHGRVIARSDAEHATEYHYAADGMLDEIAERRTGTYGGTYRISFEANGTYHVVERRDTIDMDFVNDVGFDYDCR